MRVIVFIDGQNLFHCAKYEFDLEESYPVYDPKKVGEYSRDIVEEVLRRQGRIRNSAGLEVVGTRLYTGIPKADIEPKSHDFWIRKLKTAERDGVTVTFRELKYKLRSDGQYERREKGIDVRIAIDVLMLALRRMYDVAVLFSRDGDFEEVGKELSALRARPQFSNLQFVSCYPRDRNRKKVPYGVDGWIWCPFDAHFFNRCRETRNFFRPEDQPA